ncbi:MAG: protein kinase domain-containing protein [Clostridia bacterium]
MTELDGFVLGEKLHAGPMSDLYRVSRADGGAGEALLMKVPRTRPGEGAESLLGFETEAAVLPLLAGPHVPRLVAAGPIDRSPYLVLELVQGESLEAILYREAPLAPERVARLGAAIADALADVHSQDAIHLDLKPENVLIRPDGTAVLIDFGMAHHPRCPDLLAEERRFAGGSAPYVSPEQVRGTRSDPRSDLFALGVLLYEMATRELPFGIPRTLAGLRDRLWLDPAPPRARRAEVPPWLQEVILHCLEVEARERYQSAAHVAFDLRHPEQVPLTSRATKAKQAGVLAQMRRWWRARPALLENAEEAPREMRAPVVLVAVDTMHPDDDRHPAIRRAVARILSVSADFRLICVSVVRGEQLGGSDPGVHFEHLVRLRHWVDPLRLDEGRRLSLHVIEALNPAATLLEFARHNNVDLIVIGAPSPGQQALAWWRSVASAVTANAHCSVHVVRVGGER